MTWFYGPHSLVIMCNHKWHKMITYLIVYVVLKLSFGIGRLIWIHEILGVINTKFVVMFSKGD